MQSSWSSCPLDSIEYIKLLFCDNVLLTFGRSVVGYVIGADYYKLKKFHYNLKPGKLLYNDQIIGLHWGFVEIEDILFHLNDSILSKRAKKLISLSMKWKKSEITMGDANDYIAKILRVENVNKFDIILAGLLLNSSHVRYKEKLLEIVYDGRGV
jgi:hypothetical protein